MFGKAAWRNDAMLSICLFACCILALLPKLAICQQQKFDVHQTDLFIEKQMHKNEIPGLAIIVFERGKEIYKRGFGYADLGNKVLVDHTTIFELGSNSKAFTALGIYYLEKKGLLRLDDSICKYLPWFYGMYKGSQVRNFTISNFLYQTSGVPFKSIDLIKEGDGVRLLDSTVRKLAGINLSNLPGRKFEYASMNYDVLGLVIEKVSGQSYEAFMKEKIFDKLGLSGTSAQSNIKDKAVGYKRDFFSVKEYDAPLYTANAPAGYIMSNLEDVEKWLYDNMAGSSDPFYDTLIRDSHAADRRMLESSDNVLYGGGWFLDQGVVKVIWHGGNNPTFSSFVAFDPVSQNGVAVLCNINSDLPLVLGNYILNGLDGRPALFKLNDTYKSVDMVSSLMIIVSLLFLLFSVYFSVVTARRVILKKSSFDAKSYVRNLHEIIISLILVLFTGYCLYKVPENFFNGLSWHVLNVWAPFNFLFSFLLFYVSMCFFFAYYAWSLPANGRFSDQIYSLVILSVFSGLGNTLVIFSINSSLSGNRDTASNYLLYFLLGIFLYLMAQRICRIRLIKVSNNMIYDKRKEILNVLFSSPFEKIEKFDKDEVFTVLNNDTIVVSGLSNVLVGTISSLVTIVFCLSYLSILNTYVFLGALFILIIAILLYVYIGKTAEVFLEKNRNSQRTYVGFIYGLMNGLKELKLNKRKAADFADDLDANNVEYRRTNSIANIRLANIFIVGEMLFTLVIGSIIFVLPLFFKSGDNGSDVRDFVFVFLYITGPVNGLLGSFPALMQIRVSWNRITQFKKSVLKANEESASPQLLLHDLEKFEVLELEEVEYEYPNTSMHEGFKIGPISWTFRAGEITFITGGNGSGKSTLAKLLTGLYTPSSGRLILNGREVDNEVMGQYYSTIFSDYHLFEKLYGINHIEMKSEIDERIVLLRLEDKVFIRDGAFSTSRLSSGQRKRLALLISYLEDKSICLFDEWAADQDPEFRRFFYEVLL
jgi:cyclic peptide transporter